MTLFPTTAVTAGERATTSNADRSRAAERHGDLGAPPLRTCIGCRVVADQSSLVRLALAPRNAGEPVVVIDAERVLPGRGAWIHENPECVALAVRRRAAGRSFRKGVDDAPLSEWLSALRGSADVSSMKAGHTPMETR